MKKQLIIATAVSALLASASLVSAQRGPDNSSGGMSATPAQPAEKMAPSGGKANSDMPSGSTQNRMTQPQDNPTSGSPSQAQAPSQRAPSQSQSPSQAQSPGTPTERNASGNSQINVNANLSTEQRTRIRETVIKESNAPRITRNEVNFNLRVGTVVPRTVRVAPLPAAVVSIHPAWRGYSYILVGEEIVILEPDTLRIVAIIPA